MSTNISNSQPYGRLVLNVPHSSTSSLAKAGWTDALRLAADVRRLTDWHTDLLFAPEPQLASQVDMVIFNHSRLYIDAERLIDDPMESIGQGIIYERIGCNTRSVSTAERKKLMRIYRHHLKKFEPLLDASTLLIDCHSFGSYVPESTDIDICIGVNHDASYPGETVELVKQCFEAHGYRVAVNRPFSNSLTPVKPINYHSLMIEINKRCYMNEAELSLTSGFAKMHRVINDLYAKLLGFGLPKA